MTDNPENIPTMCGKLRPDQNGILTESRGLSRVGHPDGKNDSHNAGKKFHMNSIAKYRIIFYE